MSILSLSFSRLSLINIFRPIQNNLHISPALYAEPQKKKKRLDPAIIKAREDRSRRKLEKAIRKLEKHARQLKPIDENEVPDCIIDEDSRKSRARSLTLITGDEIERRALLQKKWALYKCQETQNLFFTCNRIQKSQRIALNELRKESEELYTAAIKSDPNIMPITFHGPVRTPSIKNYYSPAEYQYN